MTKEASRNEAEHAAAMFVVVLSSFLAPFMASALNVALPLIGERFALDAVALGWVVTAYILAAAVLLLPFGRLADIYGRKKIFLYGMLIFSGGSFLSAGAQSATILIVARVINGIGAAMIFATGTAILMSVVAPDRRGKALGWNVAAVYLGLSLGPVFGGTTAHYLGWRWIFAINTATSMVAVAFILWKLKGEWAEARGERFDMAGSIIYVITLVAGMYGCSLLPKITGLLLLLASCGGLVCFVLWERRTPSPLFDVNIFKSNHVFALSNLAALINYASTFAVGFLLSLYLQYARGFTPHQAGLILIAQPIVMTVFSPMAGRLADKVAPWKLASLGMALTVAGLAAFSFLQTNTSLGMIVAGLGLFGFGFALFSSPNTYAVMNSVEPKYFGIASGTLSSMRMIGQMLSMAVVMLILAVFMGHVKISAANQFLFGKCVRMAFGVCAGLCVIGVFASSVRSKVVPAGIKTSPENI